MRSTLPNTDQPCIPLSEYHYIWRRRQERGGGRRSRCNIFQMVGTDGGDDAGAGGSGQEKGCLVVGSGLKGKDIE